jgi:hypothetical protein
MGCAVFLELVLFMFLFVHFGKINPEKLRKKEKALCYFLSYNRGFVYPA